MSESKSHARVFFNGLVAENPTLRLVLGTCPTLAVSTSVKSAIGMGVAATLVLVCSNVVISLLRKAIPNLIRIPAFITIIAGFVTIVQMLVKAYAPVVDEMLGIYLPLIVVNCIILARAEMFASKNAVIASAVDGLGMGAGFTAALCVMGAIRELFGAGSLMGLSISNTVFDPILIFILPPGGFFVFGVLIAVANKLSEKSGKPVKQTIGCVGCPNATTCSACGKDGETA